jgi:hypothetical protein
LQQTLIEVSLLERRDEEITQVVTIRKGKRLLSRAVSHLHLEERGILAD